MSSLNRGVKGAGSSNDQGMALLDRTVWNEEFRYGVCGKAETVRHNHATQLMWSPPHPATRQLSWIDTSPGPHLITSISGPTFPLPRFTPVIQSPVPSIPETQLRPFSQPVAPAPIPLLNRATTLPSRALETFHPIPPHSFQTGGRTRLLDRRIPAPTPIATCVPYRAQSRSATAPISVGS